MSQRTGEILALVPAYNEARYIADVVKGVLKHVPVVVVDDGSSDGTGAAAAMAGARVIVHKTNQGKGKTLNTAFDYAVQRGATAVITLDADGQHDPDEIPLFIQAFRSGRGDIIIGRRTFSRMPRRNQFGNRVGTWLISKALGEYIPDNQSGYRLLSTEVLRAIRPKASRFEAEVEILVRARFAGFRLAWVPIKTIYGDKVSHYQPLSDSLLFLKLVWRVWRARRSGKFE
jgi:glycosyltransferase involved in cell wall biosynthesis